ncbi:MAG: class I SAM-dependent methyltransferase [Candidatus Diapherotrites archaeon]|nr:class I SAM-dependent methyltransferase [Candidatus Diapherotrites archaeon]
MPVPKGRKLERQRLLPNKRFERLKKQNPLINAERRTENEGLQESIRLMDRRGGHIFFRTTLKEIEREFSTSITRIVLEKLTGAKSRQVNVLDLGCGAGTALSQLKETFGSKIKTTGALFERKKSEKYWGIDNLIVGDAALIKPKERFDVIYSHAGPFYSSAQKTALVHNMIQMLAPGGTAVVGVYNWGRLQKKEVEEMLAVLKKAGITPKFNQDKSVLVFRKQY